GHPHETRRQARARRDTERHSSHREDRARLARELPGRTRRDRGPGGSLAVRRAAVALTSLSRNRDFVLLQSGQVVSSIGSQCTAIAMPLLTLALTHSAAKTGLIGFLELAPLALFMLVAGVAADRWNRKTIMIVTSAIRLVSIASVVIAIALDSITFTHLAVVAFVQMTCASFYGTASEGAVRSVVPRERLATAAG